MLIFTAILAFLSVSYYYSIFLPKNKNDQSTKLDEIGKEVQKNKQPINTNNNNLQTRLENIENMIQEEERDKSMQNDCVSTDGIYEGNGICVYR